MMQIKGDYFAANSSCKYEALLAIESNNRMTVRGLNTGSQSIFQNVVFSDVKISPRIAQTPRAITFSDGAIFETLENDSIDQWLKDNGGHNALAWVHALESKIIYVLAAFVFVSLFSWGFIQYGVPSLATATAKALPVEVNQYIGQGSLALLDKSYFSPSKLSEVRQAALISKFNRYSQDYPMLNIEVLFRHGGDIGANAFALPNGQIIFTDEMVELAEKDEELVAIFGHEIGHLERRHLLRRLIQDSLLTALVVLISGDITYASSVVVALPFILLELSYSRKFEIEADQFALDFLNQNDIQPKHFAHIMLRLSKQDEEKTQVVKQNKEKSMIDGISQYLSTHPVTKERIQPFLNETL